MPESGAATRSSALVRRPRAASSPRTATQSLQPVSPSIRVTAGSAPRKPAHWLSCAAARSSRCAAANPAAKDLDVEIAKLVAKVEAGATFAQTQPVWDLAALDRFAARAESRAIPVLVGLIPPKSLKQALYFANEVPGMVVPDSLLERMRKAAEKGAEFEEEEGIALSLELAREIAARVRGLHVMPMGRYGVVRRILEAL